MNLKEAFEFKFKLGFETVNFITSLFISANKSYLVYLKPRAIKLAFLKKCFKFKLGLNLAFKIQSHAKTQLSLKPKACLKKS
ncbi:hypothetical protein DMC01_12115 [Campylobacter troglodytis]|nr:hypothetical protein DMC01_12115 [Campylobacter troglodytis]